jgi:uncharacterized protein
MIGDTVPQPHPVLAKFRAALVETYGARLERVVLYGSRAPGNVEADSDYDVAVFLQPVADRRWTEADRIAVATVERLDETGVVIRPIPYPAKAYGEQTPFMHEIRWEGVDL